MTKIAVCIAVYGQEAITNSVITQAQRESNIIDLYICDNAGSFACDQVNVIVLPQTTNQGWLKGTNIAWRAAIASCKHYDAFVLMNNDVILSGSFFKNLLSGAEAANAGIAGPLYDDVNPFQRLAGGKAHTFAAHNVERNVAYVDGTCMLIMREAFDKLGFLDQDSFGSLGWGADIDYCIRAKSMNIDIVVTHRAFLNHLGQSTAQAVIPNYKRRALIDYRVAMAKKHGLFWGRHLTLHPFARVWKALRYAVVAVFPRLSLSAGGTMTADHARSREGCDVR
jgi:GT2 family glycosyltransferase